MLTQYPSQADQSNFLTDRGTDRPGMDYKNLDLPEARTLSMQSLKLRGVVHVQNYGDQPLQDSQWAGTKGQSLRLEGFAVDFSPPVSGLGLEYMCHLQDSGDTPWMTGGAFCGTRGQSRRLEGFAIRLTGHGAANYDIYYACHLQDLGDTGPVANGAFCGTRGQSRRLEALEVWVFPKGSTPPPLFSEILPYDLVSSGPLDTGDGRLSSPRWDNLNNIPKNPFWGYNVTNGIIPDPHAQCPQGTSLPFLRLPDYWYDRQNPCTHIHVTYDSGFGFLFQCGGPHVEFRPVMYEGILEWGGKSTEGTDDDYEINIYRSGLVPYMIDAEIMNDAAMYSRSDHIEIEFDSDETVDEYTRCFGPFPCLKWWREFRHWVDESDIAAGNFINGHKAIVIAPADLDGGHDYSIELHPAWLFMVHDATSPSSDDWAFFVRNWGNKGACSDDDHQLPLQDISVLLQRPGSIGGHIDISPSLTELAGDNPDIESITESWLPGQGLVETFHLPPPDDHGWIAGYIHVVWTMSVAPPPPPPLVVKLQPKQEVTLVPAQPPAEATIASLISGMTADQRAGYLRDWQASRPHLASPPKGPVKIRQGSIPPSPAKSPMGNAVPISSHPARSRALALCKAFNNKIPGNAEVCDKLAPTEPAKKWWEFWK